jgi:dipeptidyl aminopeptidase/acylaminoacyl peptidase
MSDSPLTHDEHQDPTVGGHADNASDVTVVPYGSWPSPLSVEVAVASSRTLREPRFDGDRLFWLEGRPSEQGRTVVMTIDAEGTPIDVSVDDFDARTRVHEYGGGAYAVFDGLVVFSNFRDGRLYRQRVGGNVTPITPEGDRRYADFVGDPLRGRLITVLQDHSPDVLQDGLPRNTIAAVSLADGSIRQLVEGPDFVSDPRLDRSEQRLCWLQWNRPNMPWDGCELWVARITEDGGIDGARQIAGGLSESIVQPTWKPDGSLLFASDRSGWWNLYRWREGWGEAEPIAPMEAEFAEPQWVFGGSRFCIADDGRVIAVAHDRDRDRLFLLAGATVEEVELPWTEVASVVVSGRSVAVLGASPTQPMALYTFDLDVLDEQPVHSSGDLPVGAEWISVPEHITFPTANGLSAHAFFYRPRNPEVVGPDDERPPLLVISHGGPTANTSSRFFSTIQFFTTRGFAVVDVDYGGSTGYGRAYRERLNGQWGVVDLQDCVNAARWLAYNGEVDAKRLGIRGGSAGGYTTLCAVAFTKVFHAGASYFGVGDLEALARDTHKFESRYLDSMVAPYPEQVEVYRARSPIHFVNQITAPLLVLQGADDMVVPKAQADELVEALRRNHVPVAYLLFEGEGHGFRRAQNQRRSLEAELSFYGQVFGFTPADALPLLQVEGLNARTEHRQD